MQDNSLLIFNVHNQPGIPFWALRTSVVVWAYCFVNYANILVLYELHVLDMWK